MRQNIKRRKAHLVKAKKVPAVQFTALSPNICKEGSSKRHEHPQTRCPFSELGF